MRGRLGRALGVTALVFAGCFALVLGVLIFGEPGVPSLGGSRVALVEIEGLIVDADRVVRELVDFGEDPSVRAIVVRIQSPGGVVGPTQEIYDAILRIRNQGKPVVASMGSVAASGGYYLAAAATRIIANPGTLTGSIGVIMQLAEIEGLLKKVGVRYEVIKAVAADWQMKRLAMGLAPSPVEGLPSYLDLLEDNPRVQPRNALPRWWIAFGPEPVERDDARKMLGYACQSEQNRDLRLRGCPGAARRCVGHDCRLVAAQSTLNVGLKSSGASDDPLSKLLTLLLSIT